MDKLNFADQKFETIEPFEDEVDIAILSDEKMDAALASLKEAGELSVDVDVDEEDTIDVNQTYENDIQDTDPESVDVDYLIAAERDLMKDPFEEDELIDAATHYETEEEAENPEYADVDINDLVDD